MNKKMPAVVNYGPEPGSVEIREVPVPEIGAQDVLLAVQAVGVCGTDIHLAYGHHKRENKLSSYFRTRVWRGNRQSRKRCSRL